MEFFGYPPDDSICHEWEACPSCGNRQKDLLVFVDDDPAADLIECQECGRVYDLDGEVLSDLN